jgi:hypothetical protein
MDELAQDRVKCWALQLAVLKIQVESVSCVTQYIIKKIIFEKFCEYLLGYIDV